VSAPTLLELAAKADGMGTPEQAEQEAQAAQEQAQAATQADSNTNALCMVVAMLRTAISETTLVFNPPLRSPAIVLADEKLQAMVAPWARVLTHYGMDLGAMVDHPLIEAAVITGPMLYAAGRAIAQELRERRPVDVPGDKDSNDPGRPE